MITETIKISVSKSNNIIFTLNLLTTNLMNNNVFVSNTMQRYIYLCAYTNILTIV